MRGSDDKIIKTILFWKPTSMILRGRPRKRKRWMDVVEEDLKRIGVNDWRNIIYDREKLREAVMVDKLLKSR